MESINSMIQSDYFDKDVDFSASDFCKPLYQLWVSKNCKKNKDDEQSLPAWVGQLVHKASYDTPEIGVMKEFSAVTEYYVGDQEYVSIGGSIDRISFNQDGDWQIEDIKTQGNFPAKSAFKSGGKDEWITQLSVYKWLMKSYGIECSDVGIIHQYVMGFTKNKDGMEDYNKLSINLMSDKDTHDMIGNKIDIATGEEPIFKDCPTWMCSAYCSYSEACPTYKG